jgi:hypothetical protein
MVEAKRALQQLLAGLGEASQVVSVGQFPAVLPGLEVKGVGPIGVPVTSADAKRLMAKASQAFVSWNNHVTGVKVADNTRLSHRTPM